MNQKVRNIQPAFTCLKLTIETLEQGMKYVQKVTIKTAERRQFYGKNCKIECLRDFYPFQSSVVIT